MSRDHLNLTNKASFFNNKSTPEPIFLREPLPSNRLTLEPKFTLGEGFNSNLSLGPKLEVPTVLTTHQLPSFQEFKPSFEQKEMQSFLKAAPTSEPIFATSNQGSLNATINMGVKLADHTIPGIKYYLGPKITAINVVKDVYDRTQESVKNGIPRGQAFTCAMVGAGASELTSIGGSMAIHGLALNVAVDTGGMGIFAAACIEKVGHDHLAKVTPQVGNAAESLCHKGFSFTKRLRQAVDKPEAVSSATSLKP